MSSSPDDAKEKSPPSDSSTGGAATAIKEVPKSKPANGKPKNLPPYHVVLLNDDDHTVEYVIEMMKVLFGHPQEMGFKIAQEVDSRGRAIVLTTHREKAELKRDQIHAYGTDTRVATCKGSMSACIEPAQA
jgi:ATP-dependent Clp protease adaptor protein ClpS